MQETETGESQHGRLVRPQEPPAGKAAASSAARWPDDVRNVAKTAPGTAGTASSQSEEAVMAKAREAGLLGTVEDLREAAPSEGSGVCGRTKQLPGANKQ